MDPLKQMQADSSDRLRQILSTPVLRSGLRPIFRNDLTQSTLPDGTAAPNPGAGAPASSGLPTWAMAALAGVAGVGVAFFVFRK